MQRVLRETLVLEELKPRTTSLGAPGPGPITKEEWLRIGTKHFMSKYIIVHTDSAKAYLNITGTRHDYVMHSPKKVNGKWIEASFANNVRHTLLNRKRIWVRSGTQHIDGFGQALRKGVKTFTKAVGNTLCKKVRATHWRHTHLGDDLWLSIDIELMKSFL